MTTSVWRDLGIREGSAEGAVTQGRWGAGQRGSWFRAPLWGRSSWTRARPAAGASCANVSERFHLEELVCLGPDSVQGWDGRPEEWQRPS